MKYLIGLDIGTSSVKGVLMTSCGEVKAKAHEIFEYDIRENNVVEIPAERFLSSCLSAIKKLSDAAEGGEICALSAASASGNLVLMGSDGKPSTPIINWQDKRVDGEAKEILGDYDAAKLYEKIGWPFGGRAFPLAQLCYIKKHNPKLLCDASMVTMSTEYLFHALTGKWGISGSAGTPFYLIDQTTGKYIPELCDALEITEEKLPPIMKCGEVLGTTTKEIEAAAGIPAGIPVVLGTFDHPSAARGVGVLREGQMLLSCGTSWVAFFPVDDRDKIVKAKTLIDPFLSDDGGAWATMASVASVSARIKTYVNRYIDDSDRAFDILGDLAKVCGAGAGGLQINPTEEPDDERILKYPKENIARAIMEGTVRLLKAKLDTLSANGISANEAIMVGGPSENPVWTGIIEQICGISVRVLHGASAGAVGAAILAGKGVSLYKDEYEAHSRFQEK
ncbi:MAG: hypothetical protein IIV97_02475 [Oscillospiraceae bacterium]|nr:hypothetical protein [Oscillospiraceae bacterium]